MIKQKPDEFINRLNNIVLYARENGMRLLIESDPDYNKLYIYTDVYNFQEIYERLTEYSIKCKIDFAITDEKMYYIKEQDFVILEHPKGQKKRFYDPGVKVKRCAIKGLDIFFVGEKYKSDVIYKIKTIFEAVCEENIQEAFDNVGLDKEYKINKIYGRRYAIYRR